MDECPGCQVMPGQVHHPECDHARCPGCGEQYIVCHEHPDGPAIWHGVDQRAEVARLRGWWTTAVGIDHLVEDYTRVLFAVVFGMVTWDPQEQRYVIGEIDEDEIDASMARSGIR